jgi:hypothetical protein
VPSVSADEFDDANHHTLSVSSLALLTAHGMLQSSRRRDLLIV